MIIQTEGIVLKSFDYRETSRIATFFTVEKGKVSGILKGIRTSAKKFGSNVDRFSVNDIVYYEYRNSDLHLVSHCDLKQYFFPVRQDYDRALAANYMVELVDSLVAIEQPNHKLYQLMLEFLTSLEGAPDIERLIYILQIKALLFSGFRPHLDACVRCGKKIAGRARFSMQLGGLVCRTCPAGEGTFTTISPGTIASVLHIESHSWQQATRLGLTSTARKELKYILSNFLVYHLEKRLKSARFLK